MRAMPSQDMDRVADHVRTRRGELGLTQQQLADKAGVDTGTISSLERAGTWPWAKNRAAIERALGWGTGSLSEIRRGGNPIIDRAAEPASARYLDPAEQHIADTPGLTPQEKEALIAVMRSVREAGGRRTGTG